MTKKIASYALFDAPIHFSIPQRKFYDHEFHNKVSTDQTLHLNLKHIAEEAKRNNTVYRSFAEKIISQMLTTDTQVSWFSGPAYVIYATTAWSIILTLSLTMITLQQIKATKATKASDITNLIWLKPTVASVSGNTNVQWTTEPQWSTILMLFILMTTIVVIIVYVFWIKRKSHTTLNLVITNGSECIEIKLMKTDRMSSLLANPV